MAKLNVNGVQLHFEVYGTGPVILLTHGFAATSAMWHGQIQPLTQHHQLVLWDMRGHGHSDYPPDVSQYSEAATVADMAALLDAVGAQRAIVGGLSLGGYMSLAFHKKHPDRVRALLVIDTGPGFRNDEARAKWNEFSNATATRLETDGLSYLQTLSKEMASSSHRSADGLAMAARGMMAQRDGSVLESLPGIKVPTLVVVGAEDKPFLAASDYMERKIDNAIKVVIPDAGHAVNLDQPKAFNDAAVSFLRDVH